MYNHALEKYRGGVFERNVLDDLRLALELLLREVLGNDRSLENQIPLLGGYGAMKKMLTIVAVLLVLAAAYFIWPTPYRYHNFSSSTVRENRITGKVEILSLYHGKLAWRTGEPE